MDLSAQTKQRVGLSVIVGLGGGLFCLHAYHGALESDEFGRVLLGIVLPAVFALGVVAGGFRLYQRAVEPRYAFRIAQWTVGGAIAFVVAGILTILYQNAEGVVMSDQIFMVGNAASGGAVGGFVLGLYDSRQRRARRQSEELKNRLTVLNRVLRHDIRNRANVLRAQADFLVDGVRPPAEVAETIRRQSTEITTLGNYARDIERIINQDGSERVVLDIGSLIEGAVDRLRQEYPDSEVNASTPEELRAYAHPLITSGLVGVLENAIEHNDKEVPEVEVTAKRDGTEGVEVEIVDNGPGIPDRELSVLERGFETQLDHSDGVGLWLAHWIVRASEGELRIETDETDGTRATFFLEAAPADEPVTPIWEAKDDVLAVSAD